MINAIHRVCTALLCLPLLLVSIAPAPTRAAEVSACALGASGTGWQVISVHSGGRERMLRLFVPPQARGRRALPLVFDLHGSGGSGEQQAQSSRFDALAVRHGFFVANPDGGVSREAPVPGHFWVLPHLPLIGGEALPADAPDDVAYIRDAMDQIGQQFCVDVHRIYVAGMSGGARMTSLLACELADRIAAIAPVVGIRAGRASAGDPSRPDPQTCQPARPMPIVTFHGTHDEVNPYAGGGNAYWGYGVEAALARWVQIDRCAPTPRTQRISASVTRVRFAPCAAGSEIVLYRTDATGGKGGGHVWPGSPQRPLVDAAHPPAASGTLKASELIWAFFSRHRSP